MWVEILGVVATAILTAAGSWWLMRSSSGEPPVEGDALVLRYPPAFQMLGVLIALTGVGLVAVLVWTSSIDPIDDPGATLVVVLTFAVPGLAVVAIARRERVLVSSDGLQVCGAFGRTRRLAWRDVERVTFGQTAGALTFHGRGAKFRVSAYLVGTAPLAEAVGRRLANCGGAEAARQLLAFRQSVGGVSKR